MGNSKVVTLFMMDGNLNGRIKCTTQNRIVEVIKIPKSFMSLANTKDLCFEKTGIYLLVGISENDESDKLCVYVGQAVNGFRRLTQHQKDLNKAYWRDAVFITTLNDTLGPTDISYLENYFFKKLNEADVVELKNGNEPCPGKTTQEQKCILEEYAENAIELIQVLGFQLFETYDKEEFSSAKTYHLKNQKENAQLKVSKDNKFVLLKGTVIRPTIKDYAPKKIASNREKYKDQIDANNKLTEDIPFERPSEAGTFVVGQNLNGWTEWVDDDGKPLSSIRNIIFPG